VSLLRQRVFGILAGYEDCNDHDTLRSDPILKMVADRLPKDHPLASQPTLSRFENLATPAVLQSLIDFLITTGIERLKQHHGGKLPATINLNVDATDDPTHGQQQLTFFHGYFEQYQYFPLIISKPSTKHVFVEWLRPGTVHASLGAGDDLLRVVKALRKERPDTQIHVRADAEFGMPDMLATCDQNRLTFIPSAVGTFPPMPGSRSRRKNSCSRPWWPMKRPVKSSVYSIPLNTSVILGPPPPTYRQGGMPSTRYQSPLGCDRPANGSKGAFCAEPPKNRKNKHNRSLPFNM
jgi:hypothetical protein